jgi:uncharacterized membrane protein
MPMHILDWISGFLLFGFGAFLLYEFWKAHKEGEEPVAIENRSREDTGKTSIVEEDKKTMVWAGIGVAAWGMFVEGLEITIVWLGVSLKQGMAAATLGVLIGLGIIGLTALLLGKAGIFQKIPTKYLDLIAGIMVTIYGVYFLYEAITGTIGVA